jgi:hypothetical protein
MVQVSNASKTWALPALSIAIATKTVNVGGRRGGRGYGMKIWLFNGVGWMVNPDNVRVLAITHWRLVVRTLYMWGRRMMRYLSC